MHDSLVIPACFAPMTRQNDQPSATAARSGQCVSKSVYCTKFAGKCRLITIVWCKNLLLHASSLCIEAASGSEENFECKIEIKPWPFWKKQGSKQFFIDGKTVDVVWDFQAAKFTGEVEPSSDYYLAVVCDEEVALVVGDLRKDAYRKTGCRPALIDPMLVSRTEHVFGKKKFITRIKFHDRGKSQEVSIRCTGSNSAKIGSFSGSDSDPRLEIAVDGTIAFQVSHLQWKFRGNNSFQVSGSRSSSTRVEVCWDVHDWLFNCGPRYGLFVFRTAPMPSQATSSSPWCSLPLMNQEKMDHARLLGDGEDSPGGSSSFCLFVYAWMVD